MAITGGKGRGQDGAHGKAAGSSETSAEGDDRSPAGHARRGADQHHGDQHHGDQPHGDQPHGDQPHGDQPHGDQPHADQYHGEQGLLFGDEFDAHHEDSGYRGPTACAAAGITYRQLDYWARTGLVEPSVRPAHGSGSQRLYGFRDILVLKVVKRLLDTGISLQQIRAAVQHLRHHGAVDLAQVTLMSDGVSVYECTSPDEVVDLLQGGQGVFGIALGRVWREVEGKLAELPTEKTSDAQGISGAAVVAAAGDELAGRRARKTG